MDKARHIKIFICFFLTLITFLVYFQMKNHDFIVYDDSGYVTNNANVKKGLTYKSIIWAFTSFESANWHPVTWLSHMADYDLYRLNAKGHKSTNLILHIINTIILFLLLNLITGELWKNGFVAALFSIHPLHVESVAWIAERKDLLCAFFWFLSIWAYARYVTCQTKKRYALLVIFFSLGLMSKPMIVTLPFTLLLLDFWPLERIKIFNTDKQLFCKNFIYLLKEKIPLFVLTLLSSIITFFAQKSGGAINSFDCLPLKKRIANAAFAYIKYLFKTIWPDQLGVFYPYPNIQPCIIIICCFTIILITVFALLKARKFSYVTTGWFWYVGTLIPVIGIVQVGEQSMADRYSYIPLIGIFIIISWGASDIIKKFNCKKTLAGFFSVIVITSLCICTFFQLCYWKDSVTLFRHTVSVTANNYTAHYVLGQALKEQKKFDKAIYHYSQTLKINPGYYIAHFNLGNTFGLKENIKKAIYHFEQTLAICPEFAPAYYNMGQIFINQEKTGKAIFCLNKALSINPSMKQALYNLSWIYSTCNDGKFRDGNMAFKLAQKLCELNAIDQPLALDALAAAYAETNQFDKAVSTAEKAYNLTLLYNINDLAADIKKRLLLYKAKKTYRHADTIYYKNKTAL